MALHDTGDQIVTSDGPFVVGVWKRGNFFWRCLLEVRSIEFAEDVAVMGEVLVSGKLRRSGADSMSRSRRSQPA
jgi:hypothetical protein